MQTSKALEILYPLGSYGAKRVLDVDVVKLCE